MPTALIIVDMQRSLLEDETWDPDRIVDRVGGLERAARAAGAPVVWVTDSRVEPHGEIDARLAPQDGDAQVAKGNCDAFLDTTLRSALKAVSADHLVICGLHTDFCIDTTCRRAASLGYQVTLVEDAHSTFDRDHLSAEQVIRHHNAILADFPAGKGRVTVAPSDQVGFG